MHRLLLSVLAVPSLVGSSLCWLIAIPASAGVVQRVSEPMLNATEPQVCVMSTHSRFNLVCERVSELKKGPTTNPIDLATNPFEQVDESPFTEEESNAALALFGCDCPTCINALRSLRLMAVG
jgi:hypothetical protein